MTQRYAQYKGRVYRLVWRGTTKQGKEAAKLCFLDGSKEFWAKEGEPVNECKAPARKTRRTGRPCGYPGCDGTNFCEECWD